MRGLLLVCLLLFPTLALAQQPAPPAGSDWNHVHALPVGTGIHIKAKHSKNCNYQSSDAESITCLSEGKPLTFARADIRAVQIIRRGRSALIGMAPGAVMAAGGGIDLAATKCPTNQGLNNLFCGLGAGVFMLFGAVLVPIGAGIGAGTDFAHSTIYKAP